MFFYIGEQCSYLYKKSNNLFLDNGWTQIDDLYYKGYTIDCSLKDNITNILNGEVYNGIYCVIKNNEIYHSYRCGFPIFKNQQIKTNLKLEGLENSCTKSTIIDIQKLTPLEKVIGNIKSILVDNISNFVKHNDVKLHIRITGGLDSLLLVALLEYLQIEYNASIVSRNTNAKTLAEWFKITKDYNNSLTDFVAEKYWGYKISDVKFNENWLVNGFMGDESMLRGPHQILKIINSTGQTITDVIKPNHYHFYYFQRSNDGKYLHDFKSIKLEDAKSEIYNQFFSDFQYWHLDNNFGFSPYDDHRILENILSMDVMDIIENGLNGTVQKTIVELTKPELIILLDEYKNTPKYARVNLLNNIDKVKLNYCKLLTII